MMQSAKETEFSGPTLVPTQVAAVRAVITYLRYEVGILPREISEGTNLPGQDITNFITNRSNTNASILCQWALDYLTHRGSNIVFPDWMLPMLAGAFPDCPKFKTAQSQTRSKTAVEIDKIFLDVAENNPGNLQKISEVYCGVYSVLRYGANISVPAGISEEELRDNAFVIRAAMIIRKGEASNDAPIFTIRYQHAIGADSPGAYTEITGPVIAIHDRIYLLGLENETQLPVVVTARQEFVRNPVIHGMVMRCHREGQIMAGRVIFLRSPEATEEEFSKLSQDVGVVRENQIDGFPQFRRLIVNSTVDLGGKSMMKLYGRI